jgi:mono/diheme cytochrome c family protein
MTSFPLSFATHSVRVRAMPHLHIQLLTTRGTGLILIRRSVTCFRYACLLAALLGGGFARAAEPDGKSIYDKWCSACHDAGFTGALALQAKYKGSKAAVLTERTDLTPAAVKVFVRKGGSAMPFFRKTEINDTELGALATYLSADRGVK